MISSTIFRKLIKVIGSNNYYGSLRTIDMKLINFSNNIYVRPIHQLFYTETVKIIIPSVEYKGTITKRMLCPSLPVCTRKCISSFKISNLDESLCLQVNSTNISKEQRRNKSKNSQKRPEYDSASDSDEEEEENIHGTKLITVRTQTLRLDGLVKKALGVARNKMETAFYEGNIRVNGMVPDKKSFKLRVADEVDVIKGISPMNSEFLRVSRIEVVSIKEDTDEDGEDHLIVKLRRTKTMYIENYKTHPWKTGSSSE